MLNMDLEEKSAIALKQIDKAIDSILPPPDTRPNKLHEAMLYSIKAGGKRIRPILLLAAYELFPSNIDPLPAAIAIECIHTYSLIHDDLPSIDDSDLRRGNPTCHKQFDEPTALLAGDALLTYAFEILAKHYQPQIAIKLVQLLSSASGSEHLIGGQMEDILGENKSLSENDLNFIHQNKTAALIICSLEMGITMSDSDEVIHAKIREVGQRIGLVFQIIDDILDATSDVKTLGKDVKQDEKNQKSTYVKLFGLEESKEKAKAITHEAIILCREIGGQNEWLIQLIQMLEHRIK